MTLRTWAFLLFVGLYILVTAKANALEVQPFGASVFEQMQVKSHTAAKAVIQSVSVRTDRVIVEYTVNGQNVMGRLCTQTELQPVNGAPALSDNEYAVLLQERTRQLREAAQTGAQVELSISGPFNACVTSVGTSKGA